MQQARTFVYENRHEVKRFAKFATVGVAGAMTHFTIFNLLMLLLRFSTYVANSFGFIAAVLQNFILNRRWTFPESRERQAQGQLLQFALVSVIGLVINSLVLALVKHLLAPFWLQVLGGRENLALLIGDNFALAVAIAVVLFWNFSLNRLWTFRSQ